MNRIVLNNNKIVNKMRSSIKKYHLFLRMGKTIHNLLRKILTPIISGTRDEFGDILKEDLNRNLFNLNYKKINYKKYTAYSNPFFRYYNDLVYRSKDEKELNVIRPKKYNEEKDTEVANIFLNYQTFFE